MNPSSQKIRPLPLLKTPSPVCLLAAALWFFLALPVKAQTYRFDNWTTNNGLPQNHVSGIVQTRDGYLWFTTFDGLVRYDGINFKVFDRNANPAIPSNRFTVLLEDECGILWAGTEDGGLVRHENGVFTSYSRKDGLPDNWVIGLQEDGKDRILVITSSGSVHLRNGKFAPPDFGAVRPSMLHTKAGTRWILDAEGIHKWRDGRREDYPLAFSRDFPRVTGNRAQLFEDSRGNLWIYSMLGAVVRYREGVLKCFGEAEGFPKTVPTEIPSKTADVYAVSMCEDKEGNLWFATTGGLFQFRDGRFTRRLLADGLTGHHLTCVTTDREGTVWIGAHDRGIFRLTRQFITTLSVEEGLADRETYPIFEDRAGGVWVGSQDLSRYSGGRFTVHKTGFAEIRNTIQALCEDDQGRLWVGSYGNISYFKNGRLVEFSEIRLRTFPPAFQRPTCYAILQDRSKRLWFGTSRGVFKYENDRLTVQATDDGLPGADVKVLLEGRNGRLWAGTYGGLAWLSGNRWVPAPGEGGPLSTKIRTLHETADGTLWIGTYDGGLSRYADGRFTNFTVQQGLFNNGVFRILEDGRGNFWISCNKGIYRVAKSDLDEVAAGKRTTVRCVAYGRLDGMRTTECNGGRQPAGIGTRDGKLWFPTMDGVAVVDPEAMTFNASPPPVLVESAVVDGKPRAVADGIRLQPGDTNLEIHYTGLSFTKPEQVRFKYKLDGLDPDWVDVGTRRTAYYSYLPPGTYRFRVLAANSDGIWNETGASLSLEIVPPFYRKRWVQVLAALGLVLSMVGVYRLRIAQLRRAHAVKEAFTQQLLASREAFSRELLTSQEHERKRIASELHDGIGQSLLVIKNRALLGMKTVRDEKTQAQLEEITQSVTEALGEVRTVAYNLRPVHLERLGLSSTIEDMVETVGATSGIDIAADIAPLDGLFSREEEIHFFRIVQECLTNIVKHSRAARAEVIVHRTETQVSATVWDNGTGFSRVASVEAATNGGSRLSGLGLTGIAERVRMLGGRIEIRSAPGDGTTVSIRISKLPARGES